MFALKPYQGAAPEDASFIFIGLDANFDPEIERSSAHASVCEYLEDGVSFWQKYGVHHPFLLPGYRGDGRPYHRAFAKFGFTPMQASRVSFLELMHVPTFGRSDLAQVDLNREHMLRIGKAIFGAARHVFVPDKVARLMRATGQFSWIPRVPNSSGTGLRTWWQDKQRSVYCHLHLSMWGRPEQQAVELNAIRLLVAADG